MLKLPFEQLFDGPATIRSVMVWPRRLLAWHARSKSFLSAMLRTVEILQKDVREIEATTKDRAAGHPVRKPLRASWHPSSVGLGM